MTFSDWLQTLSLLIRYRVDTLILHFEPDHEEAVYLELNFWEVVVNHLGANKKGVNICLSMHTINSFQISPHTCYACFPESSSCHVICL